MSIDIIRKNLELMKNIFSVRNVLIYGNSINLCSKYFNGLNFDNIYVASPELDFDEIKNKNNYKVAILNGDKKEYIYRNNPLFNGFYNKKDFLKQFNNIKIEKIEKIETLSLAKLIEEYIKNSIDMLFLHTLDSKDIVLQNREVIKDIESIILLRLSDKSDIKKVILDLGFKLFDEIEYFGKDFILEFYIKDYKNLYSINNSEKIDLVEKYNKTKAEKEDIYIKLQETTKNEKELTNNLLKLNEDNKKLLQINNEMESNLKKYINDNDILKTDLQICEEDKKQKDNIVKDFKKKIEHINNDTIANNELDINLYWENRYSLGGNSGDGSYGILSDFKADIINSFILEKGIDSIIDFGCGDGNQLSKIKINKYIGIDISKFIITKLKKEYNNDDSKKFYLFDEFKSLNIKSELTISFDVLYHLVDDESFVSYMNLLFDSSTKYCIIYSSNSNEIFNPANHVKHRKFTDWIKENKKEWRLVKKIYNKYYKEDILTSKTLSFCNFYILERI